MTIDAIASTPETRVAAVDPLARILHLGMLAFGIAAWLTGEAAGDFESAVHPGFDLHRWLGAAFILFWSGRIAYGFAGPRHMRFSRWLPLTAERLRRVGEDLRTIARFRLPQRALHEGLAGFVQMLGLALFGWMALTGGVMFFAIVPGVEPAGLLHSVEEAHEIGEALIPVYLLLHAGAVVLHALAGHPVWRRMFSLR